MGRLVAVLAAALIGARSSPTVPVPLSPAGVFLTSPQFAPDRLTLTATGAKYAGLATLPLSGGEPRWTDRTARAGWRPQGFGTTAPALPGERTYLARQTPDGVWVLFSSLETGLHLRNQVTGEHRRLGQGTHASFSSTGRFVVFDRLEDDGQNVVAGEIHVHRVEDGRSWPLTWTPDGAASHPDLSEDERRLVFEKGGRIWIVEVRL
jgi:hypothetical protein